VVVRDQIRTVIRAYKEWLSTDLFPERSVVPKTLIFAKDDSHAEDIVEIVREEFGRGNEFCKKITYRAQEKSETLISEFRTSPVLRIAVTVDMISTGTDVKPLEVLIFMRDVKSQTYYEQMVGRGTRTISETDLQAVTGDAQRKTHFVLIDAVGVTETAKVRTCVRWSAGRQWLLTTSSRWSPTAPATPTRSPRSPPGSPASTGS